MAFAARAFVRLRVAGIFLGVAVISAGGTGYWLFISQQRQYIVGRNFRILSNLARQVDNRARAEARVIRNLAEDAPAKLDAQSRKDLADRWVKLRGSAYQTADIEFQIAPGQRDGSARGYTLRADSELMVEVPLRVSGPGTPVVIATLRLRPGLQPMFASRVGQGAFDAILLGTQKGKVLLSAGPSAQQIRSTGLGVLSSKTTDGKPVPFSELAQSITTTNVSFAGVDHTLFLFPCSLSSDQGGTPLVLAGLVRTETLQFGSWAISTTLVKIGVIVLLLAFVSWPFLKLTLLGDRQQVRVSDFFQLGVASVAGLAIITTVLLDIAASSRLNRDIDSQLKQLAKDLDSHATAEIRDAYAQLECLERTLGSRETNPVGGRQMSSLLRSGKMSSVLNADLRCQPSSRQGSEVERQMGADNRLDSGPPIRWPYPFFESVAFIDREGMQQIKLGTSRSVSNRISVARRDYFRTVVRGLGWPPATFCRAGNCALGSVWSWTTGEPQAVLAKGSADPGATSQRLPVAAISIPMRSLIGPVLPPGFAFVVIDHAGNVLFHSDRQRNDNEDFFVETDNNRRLRAQVAAHSAELLDINYWGSPYRAYLQPMELPDMYVVSMLQKERAWAISREWLVVTLIFIAIYVTLWVIVALATLGRNASWLWPDPARRTGYACVSTLCGVLLAGAALTTWRYERNSLLVVGISLPLVAWIGTYMILRNRPERGSASSREPLFAYSSAAVLLLLVTGVVPGAQLFFASYQLHVRSYIKNSQLVVARRLSERLNHLTEEYLSPDDGDPNAKKRAATQIDLMHDRDVYVHFLYNTSIERASTNANESGSSSTSDGTSTGDRNAIPDDDDMVLSFLEDYLPYYSEASVEWRELLHDTAGDGSWRSEYPEEGR